MGSIVEVIDITELLDQRHIGRLIGKGGSNLRAIERITKAIVHVEKEQGGKSGIKVRITGLQGAVDAAKIEIHELLLGILRESFCHATAVPNRFVGPLIGKNGNKIDNIRMTTGARIKIGASKDGFTSVYVFGTFHKIVAAVNMIKERVDSVSAVSVYDRPDRREFFEKLDEVMDDPLA